MPKIGDIVKGKEADYKDNKHRRIWSACIDCGKERWVSLEGGRPARLRCRSCAKKGKLSAVWKGGRQKKNGYIEIYQGNGKYVGEHRLIMEKILGRKLECWEVIHHVNGVKDDNGIENLVLLDRKEHAQVISKLSKEIIQLEKENDNLRKELDRTHRIIQEIK